MVLYLSEKVLHEIGDDDLALKSLKVAEAQVEYNAFSKPDLKTLMKIIKYTFKKYKSVKKAWIFGSFAKRLEDSNSDIDLLIETNQGARFSYFGLFEIQHHLEIQTNRKVDKGIYDSVKPGPWERFKKDIKLIYERP